MRLKQLVLHNVGVYAGRQKIDLTTTVDQPVVLIGGLNGCGKTTLLDSLQLCLYGRRARCAGRGSLGYDEYLQGLISRGVRVDEGASVELTFTVRSEAVDHEYRVVRAWSQTGKSMREFVSVFLDGKISQSLSSEWADRVEDLLPLELSGLFLFDGEKVKDLADDASAATVIKTAVDSLLGAGALDRLRTDLAALRRRQSAPDEDPEISSRISELYGQLTEWEHEHDALVQRRASLKDELHLAETELARRESAFAAGGGELHARRSEHEAQRRETLAESQRIASQLVELADSALPLALLSGVQPRLESMCDQSARAVESSLLLERLAQRDHWILEQLDTPQAAALKDVLTQDRDRLAAESEYQGPAIDPRTALKVTQVPEAVVAPRKQTAALIEEHRETAARLAEMDLTLARVPSDDAVAGLATAVDQQRDQVARIVGKLEVTDQDIQDLADRKVELEERLALAEAARRERLTEGDYVRRVIDHIERVRETLAELKRKQVTARIRQVEVAALDSFQRLMRKQGLVSDIRVDPETFEMTLTNSDGEPVPTSSLSAGEKQILAISLLWGLARVADRPMATVVDTPLGRLDSSNRQLLTDRYFPNAGDQVLLLSTDEEIDAKLYERLRPRIVRSYLLDYDETSRTTTVRDGYWWGDEAA